MNEQFSENSLVRKLRTSRSTEIDESTLESEIFAMDCYADAGKCIEKVLAKKGTPKSVVFELKESKQTKLVYKLVIETLKYKSILESLITKCQIEKKEKWLGKGRCLCIVYEFLIGSGLRNKKYLNTVNKYKSQLTNGFTLLKVKKKAKTAEDLLPDDVKVELPKFARVNKLLTNKETVQSELKSKGYKLRKFENTSEFITASFSLEKTDVLIDNCLSGLFAFHTSVNLSELALTKANKLVLQDRASCLPPFVLQPEAGDVVLDCCAAPGNKTHQLAEFVGTKGKVLACEADPKRYKLLSNRMDSLGAGKIVDSKLQNFFEIKVDQGSWANVNKIMLDPSCSGSGMAHKRILQEVDSEERIENLAKFQEKAIKKAMTFKKAKEISYSTCSIHRRENEGVVENVLNDHGDEWELIDANERIPGFLEANKGLSISVEPIKAATNGFFVALFRKK